MSRTKSELKSGINAAARVFTKLIEAVEDRGGTDDDIRRIETDASLRDQLAQRIMGQGQNGTGNVHRVTVDRDKKLKAMVEAGRYDWTNSDITDKYFPVEGSGTVDVDIELVHYNRVMSEDNVRQDFDARGLRPATIEELLALGASKPDLQREYPIIGLGSVWQRLLGHRLCPYLNWNGSRRHLDLYWLECGFSGICRFAAVRK